MWPLNTECNTKFGCQLIYWILFYRKYKCDITQPYASKIHISENLYILLLLQSALQPLWVLACSTIVEYSQQEGFYRVPLSAAHQTPNLEDQWLEHSNSHHQVSLMPETTRANPQRKVELWARNGQEFCRKWRLPRHFWVLLHARKFTTWDRWLYFPSGGRHAEDFIARKTRRLRPGLNPWTRVPEASTLTSRPPKPLYVYIKL